MITARKNDPESLGFSVLQRVNGVIANTDTEPMMNTTQQTNIPATQNEAWGFWGTMNEYAEAAWPMAMTAISDATGQPLESVRTFLDSRHGRHFADDVHNGLFAGANLKDAIEQANVVAGAAGLRLVRIVSVTPEADHSGPIMPAPMLMKAEASRMAVPVEAGEVEVRGRATIVYDAEPQ